MGKTVKVGWILLGNEQVPSSRLMGINMHNWMCQHGIPSEILYKPEGYNRPVPNTPTINNAINSNEFTHFIFQKTCFGLAHAYLKAANKNGITTIFILDDLYQEAFPIIMDASIVLAGSIFIQSWIKDNTGIDTKILDDFYEFDKSLHKEDYAPNMPLKAITFGTAGHIEKALEIAPILKDLGYLYEILSPHPKATKQWYPKYYEDIIESDIVVIPTLGELSTYEKAKGSNRPVMSMVLGLPVIASPYPSYLSIIEQGKTGVICFDNDLDNWKEYLDYLREQDIRERMGRAARASDVKDRFHIDTVGKFWIEILGGE